MGPCVIPPVGVTECLLDKVNTRTGGSIPPVRVYFLYGECVMNDSIFYPSLDDVEGGIVTTDTTILAKLIGFILMNPSDVTELQDGLRGTVGEAVAKYSSDPNVMAQEISSVLQRHINETFDAGVYSVETEISDNKDGTQTGNLLIYIYDAIGTLVLTKDLIQSEIIKR